MLHEKDETASTNDDARELALAGAPHGTAVLARAQTRGRGRAGRSFASPPGGLYLSVVLRPRAPPHRWALLPLVAGARVAATLGALGHDARVKWPNDILLGDKKLGGILVESRLGAQPFAVVGVGLNLGTAPLPDAARLGPGAPAPRALAERLIAALVEGAAQLDADPEAALADVRARCATLGRKVEWEEEEGLAVDVAEDGALVVEAQGARRRIVAGDVRLRQV